jgi:hypothetical protein
MKLVSGKPKGIGALRAACAAIYSSPVPIYGLNIPAELYE